MAMKKVIAEMVQKAALKEGLGGKANKAKVAEQLLLNEDQLNRRLYQTKGQQFHIDELIAIQQHYDLTDFTDEICRLSGGVFVPVAELDTLDNVELSLLQIREAAARGLLFETLKTALEDGEINRAEEKILRRLLHSHLSATSKTIESVIALNSRQ